MVPFFGLLSLVRLSVVLGEAFATGVRGCAFGLVARFRARVVDAAGDAPAWAGSAAPAEFPPGFGHKSGQVAPVSRPSLPLRVGGAVQEFVPRVTHHGRVPGGRSDLALRRCHVTKGRHALHLREPLLGLRLALEHDVSLSPPPESLRRVGAIEATERVAVAHGLMRPHSRVSRRGYEDFPVAKCLPCRGRPLFCDPGDYVAARSSTIRAAGGKAMWGL